LRAFVERRDERRMGTARRVKEVKERRRREAWTAEERPRRHLRRMDVRRGQGGKRRAREGHPRGAQALCESGKAGESCSLRPGRLAVLRGSEITKGSTRLNKARQVTHRGRRGRTGREEEDREEKA